MKKIIVPAIVFAVVIVALATAALMWDHQASGARQESARNAMSTFRADDSVKGLDVHGEPHLVYQAMDMKSTVYVDVKPSNGALKDTAIINGVTDNGFDDVEEMVTMPYPQGTVSPVRNDDGSYTDRATVDGAEQTYTVGSSTLNPGQPLLVKDQSGTVVAETTLDLKKPVRIDGVSTADDGLMVGMTYQK